MAVKESPAKVQKFTEEEIKSLTTLQSKSQNATLQFGQLYLSKIRLEEQEAALKAYVKNLEEEEAKIAKDLSDKYGKGSIDIETGEFTPIEE
jgi:archaellum component FlaC